MQTYITQLIEDIQASTDKAKQTINKQLIGENFEAHMEEFERYMRGEGKQRIRKIIGLKKEDFPPADRLTEEQLNAVSHALLECTYNWNISIDLPDGLPAVLKYNLLVHSLKYKVVIVNSGFIHLELCHYDSEACPFGLEYCRCIDTDIEDMRSTESM
jgi:hypothetical protein